MGRPLVLNQTLHGYQDGHRLLASSLSLDRPSSSRMLEMSDLAGTPPTGYGDHYISGYALPGLRSYVIASTWTAPEVPRSGAAWTHSLLLSYDDIPKIRDVAGIRRCFRRPVAGTVPDTVAYGDIVQWTESEKDEREEFRALHDPGNWKMAEAVISALYGSEQPVVVQVAAAEVGASHSGVLQIWSQQWPSLRRAFTFRTLGRGGAAGTLDLTMVPVGMRSLDTGGAPPTGKPTPRPEWLACLLNDLSRRKAGLHRFLARYGSDAASPRAAFPLLVRSWLWLTAASDDLAWLRDLASRPERDMAKLRSALVSLEVLEFVGSPGRWPDLLIAAAGVWPGAPAPDIALGPLPATFDQNAETLGDLLDKAAGADTDHLASFAFRAVALGSRTEVVLDAIGDRIDRLKTTATLVPEILLGTGSRVSTGIAAWLIRNANVAPSRFPEMVELALSNNPRIAPEAIGRFGPAAVAGWLAALTESRRSIPDEADPWLNAVLGKPELLLEAFRHGPPLTAELLAALSASWCKAFAGPLRDGEAWNSAARALTSDEIEAFPDLRARLFQCALNARTPAAEELLAKTFNSMHAEYAKESVSAFPFFLLLLKRDCEWDRCLALRISLARAFVRNRLDPRRLKHVVNDVETRSEILKLIRDEPGGSDYLRKGYYT